MFANITIGLVILYDENLALPIKIIIAATVIDGLQK